ncbi:olfactory receptor 6C4-like protein [Labeo rohita]|uniref:Olfactory receptor 6C4-like protein n=1 Tax=Labeo rohita TaxID=84645 RepID=A0A498LSW0_LABRO|nr:olfactory receptor 6C4-like protein [Labeo rohita]RXN29377.1 olfactory receptor 6C4-like protein [Labeo rohita]
MCIVCLAVRHAQAALANPECCPHCSPFLSRVLERRVRVAVIPKALFGASVTAMLQRCDLRKQEGEAFQACLRRKPIPKGPPSSRPGFDAPLRSSQSAFRSPRPPQPQQSDAQSKPAQPKGKPSFAAAAARHRPANPQGGKKRRAT